MTIDNLKTKEGSEIFLGMLQQQAETEFEDSGKVLPFAMVYLTRDPKTGEKIDGYSLAMCPLHMGNAAEKDASAAMVRGICALGDAFAVGMVTEAYHRIVEADSQDQAEEEHHKAVRGGSMKGLAGVVEVVMVQWEHCAHRMPRMLFAEIKRETPGDESSPGTLQPWSEHEKTPTSMSGRFANFLPGAGGN